ncbi:hypothetical protein KC717_05955, partial [Candidatus Dojkabacteria bacterium]|nr:hypothetical protein [Candidatus Dojkabacteria bacterium]
MPFIDLNNGNSSAQDDSSLTGQDQAAGNSLPPLEGSQDSSVEPIQNITAEQSALGSNAQSALKSPLVQPPSKQGDGLPPLKDVLMNQSSDDDSQPQQSVNNNLDTSSVNQQTAIETNGPDFQTAASQNPAPQVSNQ